MDTIPIDIYKKIAEGKGAKNVAPMSLEEAKDILKKLEKNFGLNQNKW